ncbi:MAG: uroporphyrinogen decarboxylase [Treponema sp.]|jgi:uroporphyrinogen decarboxylase|nr:uroporphyrinogen decarboxylase [Treponema sp.]
MTRKERIQAALTGADVDRVPINVWMHFSAHDQDPRSLADAQVQFAKTYDFDFIKLMPFGLYGVQDYGAKIKIFCQSGQPPVIDDYGIHDAGDWGRLKVLPAFYGSYGKQVQLAQYVVDRSRGAWPVIQTIFSPLTTAYKLAGDRIKEDMQETPELFKQALEVITETTINFVKANIEAGVDGFFFATQCARHDYLSEALYEEFGAAYDLRVMDSYKDKTFFNVVHPHGNHIMFQRIAQYPVPCINWHDRWVSPSLAEARNLTDKCLLGGIREIPYYDIAGNEIRGSPLDTGTEAELKAHLEEAVRIGGRKSLILGPGCVAGQHTPPQNLHVLRRAVETL